MMMRCSRLPLSNLFLTSSFQVLDLCLDFTTTEDNFGAIVVKDLKPGGADIDVSVQGEV